MRVLVTLLIVALAALAFVLIADAMGAGETRSFDERALLFFRRAEDPAVPVGPPWLAEVARDVSALGSEVALLMLLGAVGGFLLLAGRARAVPLLLVAAGGGAAISETLKKAFDRPRPHVVPHLSWVGSASFPSGHSMLSAVVYLTLAVFLASLVEKRRLRVYFVVLAAGISFLVGCSRVFLGVHYPTDVMGGWAAGLAWALLCFLALRRLVKPGVTAP